ncbi:MAG TPA: DUF2782 domain-containing protein [Mizugakiibacter sp.]|uniref:DUF2782 domain-containing protein n=1 Tax=Mizugakiibacter sediminis TaxID=1475481 RepID=A0A0K8QKY3_9GAMM|nr:DUF2782 domain-containing protein [Mizugakiibacter sediminis]GAP65523.1 hypothetical protein MBSD_n0813 [Mizugakiibacter sediminis]
MKRMPLMLAGALALASAASLHAQSAEPQPAPVPPPPGMDEPGVKPAAPATAAAPAAEPAPRDARGQPAPTVSVRRQDNGDTVEEYRAGGRIYMIRIIPKHGVPQTFMDTRGDGKLTPDPKQGPVSPVYYTIYQWGKPAKTVEQQQEGGGG